MTTFRKILDVKNIETHRRWSIVKAVVLVTLSIFNGFMPIVINVADLVFAVDSIPAIFGITTDRFIVYTSNIFAILGLRTFYFALSDLANRFTYLKYGLAFVLTFIGAKMLLPLAAEGLIMVLGSGNNSAFAIFVRRFLNNEFEQAVINLSLGIVAAAILFSIVLSLIFSPDNGSEETDKK